MQRKRFQQIPFNGLSKEDFLGLTEPAAVNFHMQDDDTAVIDIDGYIGEDLFREWLTGEKSPNTVNNIKSTLREISAKKIIVNINSPGGSLNDGLMIMNMLQSKKAEIVTNTMGFSASAATVIAMAGSTRRMPETSFMLLHRCMFGICGWINQNTSRDITKDCEVIDATLIQMYEKNSESTADEIANLMDEGGGYGRWISAEDALDMGLIDEVYDPADEEDENTDHLEGEAAENRMRNIAAMNGVNLDGEKDKKQKPENKKELVTVSGSADARGRELDLLTLKKRGYNDE